MSGYSKSAPDWSLLLEIAEAWGMPPYEIEEKCPTIWISRWVLLRKCKAHRDDPSSGVFDSIEDEDGDGEEILREEVILG